MPKSDFYAIQRDDDLSDEASECIGGDVFMPFETWGTDTPEIERLARIASWAFTRESHKSSENWTHVIRTILMNAKT